MPDELVDSASHLIVDICKYFNIKPSMEVVANSPQRISNSWKELLRGYSMDPKQILSKSFESNTDEMVVSGPIDFVSICQHHFLPFVGKAYVGYIPKNGKNLGLSKLARLVECYSCRLQMQEQIGRDIANAFEQYTKVEGVGVVLRATHLCQSIRGARQPNALMTTSTLTGLFKTHPAVRQEFLSLIKWSF